MTAAAEGRVAEGAIWRLKSSVAAASGGRWFRLWTYRQPGP